MIHWKELFIPQETTTVSFLTLGHEYQSVLNNNISIETYQIDISALIFTEETIGNEIEAALNSFDTSFNASIIEETDPIVFNEIKKVQFNSFYTQYNMRNYKEKLLNMTYKNCFWYSNKNGIIGDQPIIIVKQNTAYGIIKHPDFNSYGMCIKNSIENYDVSSYNFQKLII